MIRPSRSIDAVVDEFEKRASDRDDEIDNDDDTHKWVERWSGRRVVEEEYDREEDGDRESEEATIDREEDVAVVGEDLGHERSAEDIYEYMDREDEDQELRLWGSDEDI